MPAHENEVAIIYNPKSVEIIHTWLVLEKHLLTSLKKNEC